MSKETDRMELMENPTLENAKAFAEKYSELAGAFEPINLLAGVHKARLKLSGYTYEQRKESQEWLVAHGFNPEFGKKK